MNWIDAVINGREVKIAFDETSIHVYNAFPIKDELKGRGYRWNSSDKSWFITPANTTGELAILKNNLQPVKAEALARNVSSDYTSIIDPEFPQSYAVQELRDHVEQLLKNSLPGTVWVRGLVASDVKNYQWASYFDLKDEAEEKDLFFRTEVKTANLNFIQDKLKEKGIAEGLEKDLPVFLKVNLKLSQRYNVDMRLDVLDILPEYTQSKLRSQREMTLDKLNKEGILKNQQNLLLPMLITNIGLISSAQGTSVTDILAGLNPFESKYQFYFIDSRMEGINAKSNIIQALDRFENDPDISLDAIIIARGGGSEQSLAIFNDYNLCRRICLAEIPVLTAIGHEKDLSAVELCSYFTPTPSTPSGIGEFLSKRFLDLKQNLGATIQQLINYFSFTHSSEKEKLVLRLRNLPSRVLSLLATEQSGLLSAVKRFGNAGSYLVKNQQKNILGFKARIILSRSYYTRGQNLLISTIKKLDFDKRFKQNKTAIEGIKTNSGALVLAGERVLTNAEYKINNLIELTRANTPEKIIKKGFTLTFDPTDKIIKSLKTFKQSSRSRLQFYDGSVWIREEETNE